MEESDVGDYMPLVYHGFKDPKNISTLKRLFECDPRYSFKEMYFAEMDGEIAGHVALTQGEIESDNGTYSYCGISDLGVLPGYTRRGIGTHLLEYGEKRSLELGKDFLVLFGWKSNASYGIYEKFGFIKVGSETLGSIYISSGEGHVGECPWEESEGSRFLDIYERFTEGLPHFIRHPGFVESAILRGKVDPENVFSSGTGYVLLKKEFDALVVVECLFSSREELVETVRYLLSNQERLLIFTGLFDDMTSRVLDEYGVKIEDTHNDLLAKPLRKQCPLPKGMLFGHLDYF